MILLVALATSNPTFAQSVAVTLSTRAAITALGSADASERRRAREQVERYPGAFAPPVFSVLAEDLMRAGETDQALRWWYFGYLRALTEGLAMTHGLDGVTRGGAVMTVLFSYGRTIGPQLRAVLLDPPLNSERLVEDAIDLDERTPRLYSMNWSDEASLSRVWRDPQPNWPAEETEWRSHLSEARAEIVSMTRAQVRQEVESRRLSTEANAQVHRGEIASEAAQIIQSDWRGRVRPIRSMRLDCENATALATPAGVERPAFALLCRRSRAVWLNASDGERLSDAPFIAAGDDFGVQVLIRDGRPFVPSLWSRHGDLHMVDSAGVVERYRPRGWTQPNIVIVDISPSGRFVALRGDSDDVSSISVVDLVADQIVWERSGFNRAYRMTTDQAENFAFLWEENGQVVPVLISRRGCADTQCAESDLVLVDIARRVDRRIRMPRAMVRAARRHGDDTAIVYFENTERERSPVVSGVIPLPEGEPSQLIRYQEQAPMPVARALCGVREIRVGPSEIRFAAIASVDAGTFEIAAPQRRTGFTPDCAVSASGDRLLVVAPPFVHLYSIN